MEDESYRMLVLGKLNKTLDRKIAPDDHIDDVVSIQRISLVSKFIEIPILFSAFQNLCGKVP